MAKPAITGDKELDRVLYRMRTTAGRRAMKAGFSKSSQFLAKKVKAAIPSKYKDARKGIGWRVLKDKESREPAAKVGTSVGKTRKKFAKMKVKDRGKRKGVGIGARNVHWLYTGTKKRWTGKGKGPRRYTGVFDAVADPVSAIGNRNRMAMMGIQREATWEKIKKEIAKGKAF